MNGAKRVTVKCACGTTLWGAREGAKCWECEAKAKGLCLNCGKKTKTVHPQRCHEL